VSGRIRLPNTTDSPQLLKRNEHFCQIRSVFIPTVDKVSEESNLPRTSPTSLSHGKFSDQVQLDPHHILTPETRKEFSDLIQEHDDVFDLSTDCYNGASGPVKAVVNMGPVQSSQIKPQPSLLPDVDSILRQIGQWKYIITTDLPSAFYQIPLDKNSMKYCGVATPFHGIRVYARSAMGMLGSETAIGITQPNTFP